MPKSFFLCVCEKERISWFVQQSGRSFDRWERRGTSSRGLAYSFSFVDGEPAAPCLYPSRRLDKTLFAHTKELNKTKFSLISLVCRLFLHTWLVLFNIIFLASNKKKTFDSIHCSLSFVHVFCSSVLVFLLGVMNCWRFYLSLETRFLCLCVTLREESFVTGLFFCLVSLKYNVECPPSHSQITIAVAERRIQQLQQLREGNIYWIKI